MAERTEVTVASDDSVKIAENVGANGNIGLRSMAYLKAVVKKPDSHFMTAGFCFEGGMYVVGHGVSLGWLKVQVWMPTAA